MDKNVRNFMSAAMPALLLVTTLGGCGAIEIKPETNAMAERIAMEAATKAPRCSMAFQETGKEETDYAERLRLTLNLFTPAQLQTLEKHNVKICLDQRHAQTDRGFLGGTLKNVFYPATKERGAVIGLYDNGKEPRDFNFVRQFVALIVERLEKGDAPTKPVYSDKRMVNCGPMDDGISEGGMAGKIRCAKYSLRTVESTGLAQKYPGLMKAPVLP
jgi:hypothetical protein